LQKIKIELARHLDTPYFKIEPTLLCSLPGFFVFGSDGPIKLAHCKKLKLNFQGTSADEQER
jgi:hypothetical protein